MTDDDPTDDAAPLDRVRRAKARQHTDRWLDGGAVAAGAVLAAAPQVGPAFAFAVGVPESVLTAFAAATLLAVPLGAYVAGYLGGPGGGSGARHGGSAVAAAALGAAFAALTLAADAVAALLGGRPVPVAVVGGAVVGTAAAGATVGALVGFLGGRRRERHVRGPPPSGTDGTGRGDRDA